MAYNTKKVLKDADGKPIPQIWDAALDSFVPYEGNVKLTGSVLEQQKIQTDAIAGVLTFAANISTVEIYNTDAVNPGVFTVNGIAITVPAGKVFKDGVGGTPSNTVSITGATTYIVSRYT